MNNKKISFHSISNTLLQPLLVFGYAIYIRLRDDSNRTNVSHEFRRQEYQIFRLLLSTDEGIKICSAPNFEKLINRAPNKMGDWKKRKINGRSPFISHSRVHNKGPSIKNALEFGKNFDTFRCLPYPVLLTRNKASLLT